MKAIMITCIIVLFILGCSIASADTTWVHVQNISGSVTWSRSGNPYIIKGGVMVDSGGTLIIEPGVEVYFDTTTENPNAGIIIWDGGSLFVNGTATDSVFFSPRDTSIHLGNIRVEGLAEILYAKFFHMYSNWAYNSAGGGAIQFIVNDSGSIVKNSSFIDNLATSCGGAMAVNIEMSDTIGYLDIQDSYFLRNWSPSSGGAIEIGYRVFLSIRNCDFDSNSVDIRDPGGAGAGGAIGAINGVSFGVILSNRFMGNKAHIGGAISTADQIVLIAKNEFYGNYASQSAGAIIIGPRGIYNIHKNVIFGNKSDTAAGGVDIKGSLIETFKNNIIWGNEAPYYPQIYSIGHQITYCDIQGGFSGVGNIDLDPQFVNVAEGDFRLTCNSPCVDAGDPSDSLDPDFTRADMGAYYFHQSHGSGDANNDCRIIGSDVTFLVRYFKGLGAAPYPIWKADMNGDCNIRGSDVTYCVRYLKGIGTNPIKNIDCPNPEWSIPDTCDPCEY